MEQLLRARALNAAELALAATIAPAAWESVVEHDSARAAVIATRAYPLPAPDAIDSVRIAKLSSRFFLVIADARVGLSTARIRETSPLADRRS